MARYTGPQYRKARRLNFSTSETELWYSITRKTKS